MNNKNIKNKKKILACLVAFMLLFNVAGTAQMAYAAPSGGVLGALMSPTMPTNDNAGGGFKIIDTLLNLLLDKIIGPLLNIFKSDNKNAGTNDKPHVVIKPLPSEEIYDSVANDGVLKGKTIIVDPGHGGSNPGAVANGSRESDNNLAVGLKLKDRLVKNGAKVIMTRDSDRMVDPAGATLAEELAARVKIAEKNNADIFVSIHSNFNPDSSVAGAMTFYYRDQSLDLARKIQGSLVKETDAHNKGVSSASFHVLRNTTMPSVLVEMGFISNADEAKLLRDNNYRDKVAKGIYNGIVKYFD